MTEVEEQEIRTGSLAAMDAARFKRRFDWLDEAAVEVNLEVASTYAALMSSFSRCLSAIGEARSHGRSRVLRLLYLVEEKSLSQMEIGRELGVTPANITYLIDGMEREELVTRTINPADRRVTFISLTEKGEELAFRLVPLVGEFMGTTASVFSEEEKRTFVELLTRFRESAEASYLE